MARGSSSSGAGSGSYGAGDGGGGGGGSGGGGGGDNFNDYPLINTSGQIDNSGRYVLRKSFLVTNSTKLSYVPEDPPNFKATSIDWRSIGPNLWEKSISYESFVKSSQDGSVVELRNGVEGRFELDTQDELFPIGGHPNLSNILRKYKGTVVDGKVIFPQKYKTTGASGLSGGDGEEKSNPMFGKLYYTKPSAIFRHIQQMQEIPSGIWQNTGKMIERLPAGFPDVPLATNDDGEEIKYCWIVMSPQIYRRGNAYEVVRSYKLSDANTPQEVYKIATADVSGTGDANGGTSGPVA